MPGYPWLAKAPADADGTSRPRCARCAWSASLHRCRDRRPKRKLKGKTEMDALIAYLQGMGTALKNVR
jgi:cytochrome c oxidase cbb3-type subunit 2